MVTFPAAKYTSAEELIAAIDWWRSAGVDHDYADVAQDWLAQPEPEAAPAASPAPVAQPAFAAPAPPPLARIGGDATLWPKDLEGFQAWWLAEPSLDEGYIAGRVAPRGPAAAELMLLVDSPDVQDNDILLSGPRGRLIGAIVSAMGIAADAIYVASVLPRHMPLPDWDALAMRGLGDLTQHHVALASPKRVISFGSHVSSLLGHDPAKSVQPLPQIWSLGAGLPALAAPELESLLARPIGKSRLWQALLDWQHG